MGKSGESSMFAVEEKEIVSSCSLQLALDMRRYTPSTEQGADKVMKYWVERKTMESWESIQSAGKRGRCMEEVVRDMCLRRRMKQTLGDTVGARKRGALKRLSALPAYDLIAGHTKAENCTELEERLRN